MNAARERTRLRARHDAAWRDPAQVASQWSEAGAVDPKLLRATVRGRFWETLAATRATLLVTREYEHFVLALRAGRGGPRTSWLALPHPSGVAVDAARGVVHVATTRNPNQVYDLDARRPRACCVPSPHALPSRCALPARPGADRRRAPRQRRRTERGRPPRRRRHVGPGLVAALHRDDPRTGLRAELPPAQFDRGGPGPRRLVLLRLRRRYAPDAGPAHPDFPVDRRGVVFAGATREVVARGLTRPHSARLHDGRLWVDNSGYGEVGVIERGGFTTVARLPGWTRGLAFARRRRVRRHLARPAAVQAVRTRPRSRAKHLWRPRGRRAPRARAGQHHLAGGQPDLRGRVRSPDARDRLAVHDRGAPAGAPGARALLDPRDARERRSTRMSADFRFLMLGAMYENGGNTTHRFLDGHPRAVRLSRSSRSSAPGS